MCECIGIFLVIAIILSLISSATKKKPGAAANDYTEQDLREEFPDEFEEDEENENEEDE
jgi:preprotein translocase subunit SecG